MAQDGITPGEIPDGLAGEASTARAVIDDHGEVTGWSEGARLLLGYEAPEILGRSAIVLAADEDTVAQARPHSELCRWSGTVALRHSDGGRLEVPLLAHRLEVPAGGTEWLLASPLNGWEPRPGDEEMVRLAFAQSPGAMALYDRNLRLRRVNDDMARAMGLTEDQMRGLRVSETLPDPVSKRAEHYMRQAMQTGEPQHFESRLSAAGERGQQVWNVQLSVLRGEDGRVRGAILSAHEITEQYRARQRLMLLKEASTGIGSTLDVTRTAEELTEVAVPALADFVTVDVLVGLDHDSGPAPGQLSAPVARRTPHPPRRPRHPVLRRGRRSGGRPRNRRHLPLRGLRPRHPALLPRPRRTSRTRRSDP